MPDQSFSFLTLERMLKKEDFFKYPELKDDLHRASVIKEATVAGQNGEDAKLLSFHYKQKSMYKGASLLHELIIRKVTDNLRKLGSVFRQDRNSIISNLAHFLSEGVPYCIYRLDIKSFYESISRDLVLEAISKTRNLSPLTQKNLSTLISHHIEIGGVGLPRGLALSALLSNQVMASFDYQMSNRPGVYFYARYVDDILILTNSEENSHSFIKEITKILPAGLSLNKQKQKIASVKVIEPKNSTNSVKNALIEFDYLGYCFSVFEPVKASKKPNSQFRDVVIDLAVAKQKRFKTRIIRSFRDFSLSGDYRLLLQRIKYLTSNFKIKDIRSDKYKLAGIYHSYPQLTLNTSKNIKALDKFLHNAIVSRKGRLFQKTSAMLSSMRRNELLTHSFEAGHSKRIFLHFPPTKINEIQRCWIYE